MKLSFAAWLYKKVLHSDKFSEPVYTEFNFNGHHRIGSIYGVLITLIVYVLMFAYAFEKG